MTLLARILTLALLLCTFTLRAQWMHWGLDCIGGIHYNTLDPASYKTPYGNGEIGLHLSLSDPDDPRRISFNSRLLFAGDLQVYTVLPGAKLDCRFWDLVGSFQAYKKLNEKLSVYAGINLSFTVNNLVHFRSEGSVFGNSGQRRETIEAAIGQKIRKLNAGLETGFMYPLGRGFNAGLHLTYYMLKRLREDIDARLLGAPEKVSLNFRPLALKMLCTLELP